MNFDVYDNFDRPGYSLTDYAEKWTLPYGLGEMEASDTRDFRGGHLAGVRDAARRARDALAAVGLAHRLTHLPGQLSGGEQQRVALARAFAPRPRLLLADEPTGNLDQATGEHVMDLLFDLRAGTGATLMLITHDSHLTARCSRCIHLADGKVLERVA